MGRRHGGGVKSPSMVDSLSRDIKSIRKINKNGSSEQLVDQLRSDSPYSRRYSRQKLQPFTTHVKQVINQLGKKNILDNDFIGSDDETLSKNKRRKIDPSEEKLQQIETQHIKRRNGDTLNNSNGSSSILSAANSNSSSLQDESSEEEVSTSDDAIYGDKLDLDFDVMESMPRENYGPRSKKSGKENITNEDLEMEVVQNKDSKKVNLVTEGGKQVGLGGDCPSDILKSGNKLARIKNKRGKIDRSEEKLQKIEALHITRRHGDTLNNSTGSSSILSAANSSNSSLPDESSKEKVSTSDDAIYGNKSNLEFDIMKSMLRENYGRRSTELGKENKFYEDLEMEVVENKDSKKVNLVTGGGKQVGLGGDRLSDINKSNNNIRDGEESNGPMFKDLGGMSEVVEELKMEVIVPLYHPQLPRYLGVKPMAGILLHGPPGCGKTKLAQAIANETKAPFYKISATELVSGVSGASEENIRELFSKAYRTAPSIVFIDEIDAIASKRENLQREMERRIVTQLMTCMDESHRLVKPVDNKKDQGSSDCRPGYVLVIGATNRPDAVDPALRRPGRFDREIVLGVPNESARVEILSVLTSKLKVEGAFDLAKIARSTPGFVGADLAAVANKAGNLAMKRIIDKRKTALCKVTEKSEDWWRHPWSHEEMEKLSITMADFEEAAKLVQPSSRREGFSAIPNVKWDDVGGLHVLRQEFDRYIVRRIKYPADYEDFGVDLETGFLLYGPPGCGKTLIAKAVANEAGANFIHIKGPELLNKYVGESELAVRTIFSRARTCSPCILFFDEVDALTTKRGKEGGWVVERLLNQLLIELDGADQRRGVYVIGATNRPEVMDRAILRPGRFGKLLYVPLPTPDERGMILKALARKKPIDASVDLMAIGKDTSCENLSGADLSSLINEAAMTALEDKLTSSYTSSDGKSWTIQDTHFERALKKISPSVSDKQKQYYKRLSESFQAA